MSKKYKNWKAICQIPDTHVMWALALLNMDSDLGRQFVERFPEYFSEEQQEGPIPMSVLRMQANQSVVKETQGRCDTTDALVFQGNMVGGVVDELPLIKFAVADVIVTYPDFGFSLIPEELESAKVVGTVYKWQGKNIILLERMGDGEWYFTPAECIALDR